MEFWAKGVNQEKKSCYKVICDGSCIMSTELSKRSEAIEAAIEAAERHNVLIYKVTTHRIINEAGIITKEERHTKLAVVVPCGTSRGSGGYIDYEA